MTEFCFDCIFYGECNHRRYPPANQSCLALFSMDNDTDGHFEGELEGSGDVLVAEIL